jgi:hypothetical protein
LGLFLQVFQKENVWSVYRKFGLFSPYCRLVGVCTFLVDPRGVMPAVPVGDGFFPVVSSEVAIRNRKRHRIIVDRLGGVIFQPLLLL